MEKKDKVKQLKDLSSEKENWDFKIESSQNSLKKKKNAKIPEAKYQKLKLEENKRSRVSRTALAKKYAEEDLLKHLEYPSLVSRLMATSIDYGMMLILFFFCHFLYPQAEYYYIEYLALQKIDQTLAPEVLYRVYMYTSYSILWILYFYVPIRKFQKTFGKGALGIRVGEISSHETATSGRVFIREFFLKPLSLISIIGALMAMRSEKGLGLHDYLSGTCLYKELS